MKNILLIAPHPDDEIAGAFMIIKNFLNTKIIVFFLTNGVIDQNSLWFWQRGFHEEKSKKEKKR